MAREPGEMDLMSLGNITDLGPSRKFLCPLAYERLCEALPSRKSCGFIYPVFSELIRLMMRLQVHHEEKLTQPSGKVKLLEAYKRARGSLRNGSKGLASLSLQSVGLPSGCPPRPARGHLRGPASFLPDYPLAQALSIPTPNAE